MLVCESISLQNRSSILALWLFRADLCVGLHVGQAIDLPELARPTLAIFHLRHFFIKMSQSQKWWLSQKANKSSGECSVCHAVRQLHLDDGTVYRHVLHDNPCPGSDKPPAAVLLRVLTISSQQLSLNLATSLLHRRRQQ